jgi:hypothetical protein
MIEIIKTVQDFPNYEVSNLGYVKSKLTGKVLKLSYDKRGYQRVALYRDGLKKTISMHRVVALNFIKNLENKAQVNHIDGNKQNNYANNLEWNTCQENIIHANANGLFDKKNKATAERMRIKLKGISFNHKNVIDLQTGIFYESLTNACNTYNLSYSTEVKRTRKERNNRFQYI